MIHNRSPTDVTNYWISTNILPTRVTDLNIYWHGKEGIAEKIEIEKWNPGDRRLGRLFLNQTHRICSNRASISEQIVNFDKLKLSFNLDQKWQRILISSLRDHWPLMMPNLNQARSWSRPKLPALCGIIYVKLRERLESRTGNRF